MTQEVEKKEYSGIFIEESVEEKVIVWRREEITLKVKELPWSRVNRIIADATTYSQTGQVGIDLDAFYATYLTEAVLDSPWGRFTKPMISRFTQEFGQLLVEHIIPNPSPTLEENEETFFDDQLDLPS